MNAQQAPQRDEPSRPEAGIPAERQPWTKPTFEQVPLNEALAGAPGPAGSDAQGYAS